MKKTIITAMLAIMAFTASAQHREKFSASISAGISPTEYGGLMPTLGYAFTIYGVYTDASCKQTHHSFATDNSTWHNEMRAVSYHIGYRFAFDTIGITPIIGVHISEKGTVRGGRLTLDMAGLHNQFIPTESHKHVDYGIVLDACLSSSGAVGTKISCKFARHDIELAIGITI